MSDRNNNNSSVGSKLFSIVKPDFMTNDRVEMKTQFTLQNLFEKVNFQQQAKDSFGNLHPQYQQPIKNGVEAIKDYVQLYSNDILNGIREIDFLCIKTADRKMQNYQKCKQQTNMKIHKQIIVPLVNASTLLYRVSNQCLLKGNSVNICSNIVSDHTFFTFKLASEKIKAMAVPMMALVPDDIKAGQFGPLPINNSLIDVVKKQ